MPLRLHPALRRLATCLCLSALLAALGACSGTPAAAPGRPAAHAAGGPLRVASSPVGARVLLDGAATNFRTPTTIAGLPPGRHRLLLTLPGHRNWSGEVDVEPLTGAAVAATLAPLATGSLTVESVPAGAELLIDGQRANLATPAVVPRLAVGTHTVQVRRDGYEVWSQAVVVMQDRRLAIRAVLAPERGNLGHLAIQSRPARARIAVDGYPSGKLTPDTLFGLQPGAHRVELALAGHRPWRGEVTIREGRTEDLLVTLQRLASQPVGSARIESDPPGATIAIDGVPLRRKTPAELEGLAAGSFPLAITRPGSRPWRGELTVSPGECTVIAVKLEPEARYGGSVRIESEPPGARVAVDEVPWGAPTPTLVPNLSPAGHRIELTLAGFRPWAGMAQVEAGTTGLVRARLVPRPFAISARVLLPRIGEHAEVEVEVEARRADGGAAEGRIALELAAEAGARRLEAAELAGGVARVRVPPPAGAAEVSFSVLLGDQRELFLLRRGKAGWEVCGPE